MRKGQEHRDSRQQSPPRSKPPKRKAPTPRHQRRPRENARFPCRGGGRVLAHLPLGPSRQVLGWAVVWLICQCVKGGKKTGRPEIKLGAEKILSGKILRTPGGISGCPEMSGQASTCLEMSVFMPSGTSAGSPPYFWSCALSPRDGSGCLGVPAPAGTPVIHHTKPRQGHIC